VSRKPWPIQSRFQASRLWNLGFSLILSFLSWPTIVSVVQSTPDTRARLPLGGATTSDSSDSSAKSTATLALFVTSPLLVCPRNALTYSFDTPHPPRTAND